MGLNIPLPFPWPDRAKKKKQASSVLGWDLDQWAMALGEYGLIGVTGREVLEDVKKRWFIFHEDAPNKDEPGVRDYALAQEVLEFSYPKISPVKSKSIMDKALEALDSAIGSTNQSNFGDLTPLRKQDAHLYAAASTATTFPALAPLGSMHHNQKLNLYMILTTDGWIDVASSSPDYIPKKELSIADDFEQRFKAMQDNLKEIHNNAY